MLPWADDDDTPAVDPDAGGLCGVSSGDFELYGEGMYEGNMLLLLLYMLCEEEDDTVVVVVPADSSVVAFFVPGGGETVSAVARE